MGWILLLDGVISGVGSKAVIDNYLFTERKPIGYDVVKALNTKSKILERKPLIERTTDLIIGFIDTFIEGI
jgi:hypothetical protein